MRILRRLLVTVVVTLAVISVLVYWVAPVIASFYITKKAPPAARRVPSELKDLSISQASGKKLSYFGYEFEVPWDDVDEAKTELYPRGNPNRVTVGFRSGLRLSFAAASSKEMVNAVATSFHVSPQAAEVVFGREATRSDYAFRNRLYQLTPDRMHLWTVSPNVHYREAILLLIKSISLSSSANSGVFNVRNSDYQGFQEGNPGVRPDSIIVDLYSEDIGLDFIFSQKDYASPVGVSQPEINRIIRTLHKITRLAGKLQAQKP